MEIDLFRLMIILLNLLVMERIALVCCSLPIFREACFDSVAQTCYIIVRLLTVRQVGQLIENSYVARCPLLGTECFKQHGQTTTRHMRPHC